MNSNTAKTHEDELKDIIKKQTIKRFDYNHTGYYRRIKNLDIVNQKDLINYAEYTLFYTWAKECKLLNKEKKPPSTKNEDMPTLDHQVLRNLYFGAYPNSTKAKNSIRKMVKTYKEKYHQQETPINCNKFSDIIEQRRLNILDATYMKFRSDLRQTSVYTNER